MARQNRAMLPNGTYHITSRIVNREMWFRDPHLKDEIVERMYGIAAFSGVELLSWCIMDNHFHLLIHVPEVPERYRLDPSVEPASYAFGMRPPECNPSLWSPDEGEDSCSSGIAQVDSPRQRCHISHGDSPMRPPTGFTLPDEELLERLVSLYGDELRVAAIARTWEAMRKRGDDAAVEAIKERYCRRMYNLSQFTKTFKECISRLIMKKFNHVGHVFEGRFYSGLVQNDMFVKELVSLYIDYNPYKAEMVRSGDFYLWSSFGQASCGGAHGKECRAAYERIFGCDWTEAKRIILEAFCEKIPEGDDIEKRIQDGQVTVTMAQIVKLRIKALTRGAFIGRSRDFADYIKASLPRNFPRAGMSSLEYLMNAVAWPATRSSAA